MSDADIASKCRDEVAALVQLLALGRYEDAVKKAPYSRLSAEDLARAVTDYGRTIEPLPPTAWDLVDIVPIEVGPRRWSVSQPLFTVEEGRSDLTLSLTAVETPDGGLLLEIDDLHVP